MSGLSIEEKKTPAVQAGAEVGGVAAVQRKRGLVGA